MAKKKKEKDIQFDFDNDFDSEDAGFYHVDDKTLNLFEKGITKTITKKENEKLRKLIHKKFGI